MATNLIPFESAKLPAHVLATNAAEINADLTSHGGIGYPVLSIKGKTFTVVRGSERTILPNPKDPDSPATNIDVVIVKANKATSKIYYIAKFEEGVDAKPDCYSNDGVTPATDAQKPQAKFCATCPHNQWGARITESGKKAKACQDNVRLALTTPSQLNEPYLMRVPPMSFKALTEYGQMLAKRGVKYNAIVTKIGFEAEAATPQLTFKPVGFLDEAACKEVMETAASDIVASIISGNLGADPAVPETAPNAKQVAAAAVAKAATKETPVPPAEVAATVPPTEAKPAVPPPVAAMEVDLEGIDFDDV